MEDSTLVKKNDFVSLDFTGISDGKIFDTTNKDKAKESGIVQDVKPIIISVGNEMVIKGLDNDLIGKNLKKSYTVIIPPALAFGNRNPQLVKTIPLRVFREKNINPFPGMSFQMDQYIVKILSVSGGRVIADFNHPLAGKELTYEYTITKKIEDINEKVNALQDYFFKQRFSFILENKNVIFKDSTIKPLLEMFKDKFKQITGYEFLVQETPTKNKKNDS